MYVMYVCDLDKVDVDYISWCRWCWSSCVDDVCSVDEVDIDYVEYVEEVCGVDVDDVDDAKDIEEMYKMRCCRRCKWSWCRSSSWLRIIFRVLKRLFSPRFRARALPFQMFQINVRPSGPGPLQEGPLVRCSCCWAWAQRVKQLYESWTALVQALNLWHHMASQFVHPICTSLRISLDALNQGG
jgi:hypothetical protein